MKHSTKIIPLLSLLLCIMLLSCDKADYNLVSSYQGIDNMKVFVCITSETNIENMKDYAQDLPHEDCATTSVFFYSHKDPTTVSVNNASTFDIACEKGCTKKCIAGYWKYASGMDKIVANTLKD